ncbi:unnamed protein product [Lota lota]
MFLVPDRDAVAFVSRPPLPDVPRERQRPRLRVELSSKVSAANREKTSVLIPPPDASPRRSSAVKQLLNAFVVTWQEEIKRRRVIWR